MRYFFALVFVTHGACYAYLDPASGSLLLSSIVAIGASIAYFFKNLFYSLINFDFKSFRFRAVGGRNDPHNSIVIYSEGPQYYGTFVPIVRELERLGHPYTYLTSDKNEPIFNTALKVGKAEFIGTGNAAYRRLNSLVCDILLLTTPGLNVLHIRKTAGVKHYCHIVHSITPMTYRVFGVDYFDSVLVVNEAQEQFVRDIEIAHGLPPKHIIQVGSTYLDELAVRYDEICRKSAPKKAQQTLLISPSWGRESLLTKYGLKLLEPLAKSGLNLIIRPHPQSLIGKAERENVESIRKALEIYDNVSWDIGTENVFAFAKSDAMLSDFSSVIFDYVLLTGKPILTMDFAFDPSGYDVADVVPYANGAANTRDFYTFKKLREISCRVTESEVEDIESVVLEEIKNGAKYDKTALNAELYSMRGAAGSNAARALLKIEAALLESKMKQFSVELSRLEAVNRMLAVGVERAAEQPTGRHCEQAAKPRSVAIHNTKQPSTNHNADGFDTIDCHDPAAQGLAMTALDNSVRAKAARNDDSRARSKTTANEKKPATKKAKK